jgi:hypothetical protein
MYVPTVRLRTDVPRLRRETTETPAFPLPGAQYGAMGRNSCLLAVAVVPRRQRSEQGGRPWLGQQFRSAYYLSKNWLP